MVCYNLEWFGLLVTSGWPANFRISYPETRFIFREKYCQVDGRFANALTILAVNCISQKCFQTPMPCHAMHAHIVERERRCNLSKAGGGGRDRKMASCRALVSWQWGGRSTQEQSKKAWHARMLPLPFGHTRDTGSSAA